MDDQGRNRSCCSAAIDSTDPGEARTDCFSVDRPFSAVHGCGDRRGYEIRACLGQTGGAGAGGWGLVAGGVLGCSTDPDRPVFAVSGDSLIKVRIMLPSANQSVPWQITIRYSAPFGWSCYRNINANTIWVFLCHLNRLVKDHLTEKAIS